MPTARTAGSRPHHKRPLRKHNELLRFDFLDLEILEQVRLTQVFVDRDAALEQAYIHLRKLSDDLLQQFISGCGEASNLLMAESVNNSAHPRDQRMEHALSPFRQPE